MMSKTHHLAICLLAASAAMANFVAPETLQVLNGGQPTAKPVAPMGDVKPSPKTAKRLSYAWNHLKFDEKNSVKKVDHLRPGDYSLFSLDLDLIDVVNNRSGDAWLSHQYTKSMGHPKLVNAIAGFFSPLLQRNLDQDREPNTILVTAGASQAVDTAIRAFVDPGDEVIVFEPTDYMYEPAIRLADGIPVWVPLRPKVDTSGNSSQDWTFDVKELQNSVSERTVAILLNNPNQPYGKVYTLEELTVISRVAIKHNLIVISDEREQFLNYEEQTPHIRIATLPAMWERTITITSGGNMFSAPGFRIGWSIGPAELLWGPAVVASAETLHASTPIQLAISYVLEREIARFNGIDDGTYRGSYIKGLTEMVFHKRNKLLDKLRSAGIDHIKPAGGHSICANFTKLAEKIGLTKLPDSPTKLTKWLSNNVNISATPVSLYYQEHDYGVAQYMIRFQITMSEGFIDKLGEKIVNLANKYN